MAITLGLSAAVAAIILGLSEAAVAILHPGQTSNWQSEPSGSQQLATLQFQYTCEDRLQFLHGAKDTQQLLRDARGTEQLESSQTSGITAIVSYLYN